jgi:hypothetical protein
MFPVVLSCTNMCSIFWPRCTGKCSAFQCLFWLTSTNTINTKWPYETWCIMLVETSLLLFFLTLNKKYEHDCSANFWGSRKSISLRIISTDCILCFPYITYGKIGKKCPTSTTWCLMEVFYCWIISRIELWSYKLCLAGNDYGYVIL